MFLCKKSDSFESPFPFLLKLLKSVLLLELVYASACVYQFLLTGKVGMALVTNFYLYRIGVLRRSRLERSATSTYNSRFVIIRMYTLFHFACLLLYFGLFPILPVNYTPAPRISQAFFRFRRHLRVRCNIYLFHLTLSWNTASLCDFCRLLPTYNFRG